MDWKIPLFKTYWEEDDVLAVSSIIRRGSYWSCGPEIQQFEDKIAGYLQRKYVLAFNSGTSALYSLLVAHGISDGEVIVPSFTFVATANAVVLAGGKPVFAECESQTFGLDVSDVRRRITKDTKAIMPIHYGGFPCRDIEELRSLAEEYGILLIEDAAESFGASINGKKVGTFGHSAMFSTCQNKVLATGEGGFIVTDSQEVYEKCKLIRSHGRVELAEDYFSSIGDNDYIEAGFNFRMPTIIAALGISQFNKLNKIIEMRKQKARYMNEKFMYNEVTMKMIDKDEIIIPLQIPGHMSVYQMYTIQVKYDRDALQKYLADNGIMSKVYFNPVHSKALYNKQGISLPKTEELSSRVLNIPLYPDITNDEIDYIVQKIGEFYGSRQNISE